MFNIKIPIRKSNKEIEKFFFEKKLGHIIRLSKEKPLGVNQMNVGSPYKPELHDLYRLYQFIVLNKRTTVLEFGTGWSSLIFTLALSELKKKFNKKIKTLRRNNPFELFILDNEKKFLDISKKRIKKFVSKKCFKEQVHFKFSNVSMTQFNGRISTEYDQLPLCNPDFIYLDGPDQFNVKKKVNNISTNHKDLLPMSCDLLKIEYFLIPGTIIIVDGRGANSNFLKTNFKRNWLYKNDTTYDQHIFYLNDPPFGKYNKMQLDFYKNNKVK